MEKKNIWGIIIQTLITILTAIGTTLGITSCMVSTQFRASPVERALSSALNRVMLKISFEN